MSTSDQPPHELRGPLGQVIDAGGGITPALTPPPVPNAVAHGGRGAAASVAQPIASPTLPSEDPAALALLFARVANELFSGASVASPPQPANLFTGGAPASPGISPMLTPPQSPSPAAPSTGALPAGELAAAAAAPPGHAVAMLPSAATAPAGSVPVGGVEPPPAGTVMTLPLVDWPTSALPSGGSPSGGLPVAGLSSGGSPSGGSPSGGLPVAGLSSGGSPSGGSPSGGSPSTGWSSIGSPVGGWPGGEWSGGGWPSAGIPGAGNTAPPKGVDLPRGLPASSGTLTGVPDRAAGVAPAPIAAAPPSPASLPTPGTPGLRLDFPLFEPWQPAQPVLPQSLFEGVPIDAAPSYLPAASAVGPYTELGGPNLAGHELRPAQPALIRDLGASPFDPYRARADFPILEERVHGKRLVWLDNAATTQKPKAVIDRLSYYYTHENSNIHRAAHTLAARATDAYEQARETTAKFLNAPSSDDILFVRGATEGINLIAQSWGRRNVHKGDEIVLTWLEHHANIVPWQQLCAERGARLRVAPVDDRGDLILEEYERLLNPRTRLVAFPQVSNALGTITPAREIIQIAHRFGARVMLDGAQAVSHMRVDVQQLDCDFYVFSGHKVFAPTGIGAVYGKRELLEQMPPWQGGGNMIQDVTFERTVYQPPPFRFEAGTGSIADAAGLGAALEYVMGIGIDVIDRYEHELLVYATERLATVPGLRMIGTSPHKAGVLSFVLDGQRTEDVGGALDLDGIAVRSGHHCAQPILRRFGLESTVRASLAFYNVREDIDALVGALHRMQTGRGRGSDLRKPPSV